MKKVLLIILLFLTIFTFTSCKKKNNEDKPVDPTDDPTNEPTIDKIECETNYEIYVGEKITLDIKSDDEVSVTSLNPDIVKTNGNTIEGLKEGVATIKLANKTDQLELQVKVTKILIESTKTSFNLKLSEQVDLNDYLTSNLSPIQFEIKDADIVTIEGTKLIPLKEGETVVTCFVIDHDFREEIKLNVTTYKEVFNISTTSLDNDIHMGDQGSIVMTSDYTDDEFEFVSSDSTIFSIDELGNYEALKEGTVTVTITSKYHDATFTKNIKITYVYPIDTLIPEAIYLGIYNFGTVTNSDMANFKYRFFINGKEEKYTMTKVGDYELQNQLEEGNLYYLTIDNNVITNLAKCDGSKPFVNPDESSLIVGHIKDIDKYRINIDNISYDLLASTKFYTISKVAGGASLSTTTLSKDQYVIMTKSAQGYCQNVYVTSEAVSYTLPIVGVAGERTLTNFLKTALSAVGHALYIYGGAWDFQDVGSSNQARSIGVASSWVQFFYEQDKNYSYKNTSNHAKTYYPFGSFNEYYYAGVDCSGFVGWVIYNIMNTESGHEGYVMSSTKMAKNFSNRGWGTYTRSYSASSSGAASFKVGDIISCSGHVWICLGVCSDNSIVIIHSTPSESHTGSSGGGAQLGAIGNNTDCEAYKLADQYNKAYYQDWSNRYPTSLKSYSTYLSTEKSDAGKFSWYLNESGVLDPDGIANMEPKDILALLFS